MVENLLEEDDDIIELWYLRGICYVNILQYVQSAPEEQEKYKESAIESMENAKAMIEDIKDEIDGVFNGNGTDVSIRISNDAQFMYAPQYKLISDHLVSLQNGTINQQCEEVVSMQQNEEEWSDDEPDEKAMDV